MRNFRQILFVGTMVLALLTAGCSGWLGSAARDDYKAAQDKMSEGKYSEALVLGTQSVLADPKQKRPKKFMYENFDEAMAKIKTFLKKSEGTSNADEAARRFETYSDLVKIYANIGKMKLPLNHKGKFKWETEVVDYSDEQEAARLEARRLYFERGQNLLTKFKSKDARKAFQISLKSFTKPEEKEQVEKNVFEEYTKHGRAHDASDEINEAYSAFLAFKYAFALRETQEVEQRLARVKLHISDLFVAEGQELENKKTLESLKEAVKHYEVALEWNEENEEATDLLADVKTEIGDMYYQKGLAAQKSSDRDLAEVKNFYAQAREWAPGHKDVTQRFHTFDILVEIQKTQAKIDKSISEHAKISKNVKKMVKRIDQLNKDAQKLVALTNRVNNIAETLQTTIYAIQPLGLVPMVNTVAKPMGTMLKGVNMPLKKTNNLMQKAEKATVRPMITSVEKAKGLTDKTDGVIDETGKVYNGTRTTFATAEQCLMSMEKEEQFEEYSNIIKEFNSVIDPMNKALVDINTQMNNLSKVSEAMSEISKEFGKLDNQMKAIDRPLNEANKVTSKIDNALSKEVSVGTGPLKVSASVKDGLEKIDKLQSVAYEFVKPYLEDLTGIQVPQVPTEPFERMMGYVEEEYKKIDKQVKKASMQYDKCQAQKNRLMELSNRFKEPCGELQAELSQ